MEVVRVADRTIPNERDICSYGILISDRNILLSLIPYLGNIDLNRLDLFKNATWKFITDSSDSSLILWLSLRLILKALLQF